jgi:hypothetical protein
MVALRTEPELASVVRDEVLLPMRERARADICRIVGADNPHVETLADIGPGLLVFRTVMLGEEETSEGFLAEIIDLITSLAPGERDRPRPAGAAR